MEGSRVPGPITCFWLASVGTCKPLKALEEAQGEACVRLTVGYFFYTIFDDSDSFGRERLFEILERFVRCFRKRLSSNKSPKFNVLCVDPRIPE